MKSIYIYFSLSLFLPFQFCLLPSCFLLPCDDRFGADAAKYQPDAEPLASTQPVAEPHHGKDHRQHLAGYRHGH